MWKGNNDNPAPNPLQQKSNVSQVNSAENRSLNVRRDTDNNKDFTVSLLDIDTAIFEYIDKVIDVHVMDNGQNIKVPIIWASQEKWKAAQKDGVFRDGQGKIQMPMMAFSRNNVAKNQSMMTLNRHLTYPVIKKFTEKNKYTQFNLLNNSVVPVNQVFSVTLPDHVDLSYEFVVQTEYVEQLNKVIQKINWAAEEYWGDPDRFRFRVYIDDYTFTSENPTEDDRVVKGTFTAKVKAYLLEESMENRKLTTQKQLTKRKVVIGTELETNESKPNLKSQKPYPYSYVNGVVMRDGEKFEVPGDVVKNNIIDELMKENIIKTYEKISVLTPTIWQNPPASSTSYGEEGWQAYDEDYYYIYISGKWYRHTLSAFESF